jgi:acyl carrier protein phosphodiesterase
LRTGASSFASAIRRAEVKPWRATGTLAPVNWLAHLLLAPAEPRLRIGNLAGDFVRGVDLATLHPAIRAGVWMHRAVDRFVDAHEVVKAARRRCDGPERRFAGVLVDVFFDHCLARHWQTYGEGDLAGFAAARYAELAAHVNDLPPRLRDVLPWLVAEDWLTAYASDEGLGHILTRMAARSPRRAVLAGAAHVVRRHRAAFDADFAVLWPEVRAFVAGLPVA